MKKLVVWFLTLSVVLSLTACGDEGSTNKPDRDDNPIISTNDTTTIPEENSPAVQKTGLAGTIEFTEYVDGEMITATCRIFYDENGLSRMEGYNAGELVSAETFAGNLDRPLSVVYYSENGEESKTTYKYDDDGYLLEEMDSYQTCYYAYDDAGNRIEEKICYQDGYVRETHYTYNEKGELVKEEHPDRTEYYEYDSRGNVIWQGSEPRSSGNDAEGLIHDYTYDDRGNILEWRMYTEGFLLRRKTYAYDENGNKIEEKHFFYYNHEEYEEYRTTWQYEDGLLMQWGMYSHNVNGEMIYQYGDNGQLIRVIQIKSGNASDDPFTSTATFQIQQSEGFEISTETWMKYLNHTLGIEDE